jgi:hypothetical protein
MLRNFSQFNEQELTEIDDLLRENNIYMINITETDYKNYWIYMNKILTPVFVENSIDMQKYNIISN